MRNYFYYKDKKRVAPVLDEEKNKLEKKKLAELLKTKKKFIPEYFLEKWADVYKIINKFTRLHLVNTYLYAK